MTAGCNLTKSLPRACTRFRWDYRAKLTSVHWDTTWTTISEDLPEVTQELDFTKGTLTEHGMVERCDTLNGDLCSARNVHGGAVCQHVYSTT